MYHYELKSSQNGTFSSLVSYLKFYFYITRLFMVWLSVSASASTLSLLSSLWTNVNMQTLCSVWISRDQPGKRLTQDSRFLCIIDLLKLGLSQSEIFYFGKIPNELSFTSLNINKYC